MPHAIVLQLSVYVYSGWRHLFFLVKFVLNSVLSETGETIQTQGGPQDTDGFEKNHCSLSFKHRQFHLYRNIKVGPNTV